ncbi:MAG: LuxR C-terminal-related transcriptional regulator [Rickettsiaceae bacterium]|nr:LuxR C-terminal-related transcriptional regulator [Rickettsiaceae bacterium]MDD9337851.1 LuxR C-terminal-related transcriptional regulator [Rickettsiaceae bacterium]
MEDKEILCPQEIYEKHLMIINGIRFTPREIDIIACIMHGKNAKGIANFLSTKDKSLETKTIESHILNIKRKIAANSREGIISFIEKSDKLSFLIVLPRLGKDNLNLLVNKLCIDLRLIGITVSIEFQENPNTTPIVVCLKHKEISSTGIQLKQCTIYVLAINEANIHPTKRNIVLSL